MKNKRILLTQSAIWAAYNGLTSTYLVAFALALGASNTMVGFLGALPWLANLLTQIPGAELVQRISRKKIIIVFDTLRSLFWIPILAVPFFFTNPLPFLIVFYLFTKLCEYITSPAYKSLLADIIHERHRGEFISIRHRLINVFGMVAVVLGGLWLKQFPKESPVGFAFMFGGGVLLGLLSAYSMRRVKDPPYQDHEHHTVKEFFTLTGQMKRFVMFSVAFNFAWMLAAPLITVYMLKTLDISYQYFGIAVGIVTLSKIISSHHFGKLTDRYGDKPIALIGHIGTALIPLLFLTVNKGNLWLLIPIQIYAGIVWAAADISQLNILLDLADPRKRALQIAEYNLYVDVALIAAPILGGWMSENVTWILAGIPLVFVLSAVLRFFSSFMLFTIKEPRAKHEYSMIYVIRKGVHFHPSKGLMHVIHVLRKKRP